DQLLAGVEPLDRLADDRPVLRVLERHLSRRRELAGGGRDLAERGFACRWPVRDDAAGGAAFGWRHAPFFRGSLDPHLAGDRAALADVLMRIADGAAASGVEVAPDALARDVLSRRRIFGRDFRPVAFELLGHELREAGERALPHLGAGDA